MEKNSIETVLSIQNSMFPEAGSLCFLSATDLGKVRSCIQQFQEAKAQGKNARSGGSQLLKELEKIEIAKENLGHWIENIYAILYPAVVVRATVEQVKAEHADELARIAESTRRNALAMFSQLSEKTLRAIANSILGENADNYTVSELPEILVSKQQGEI